MSILDNIGDNLDKQHENHNFLPQKIELEDIDLGVRDFFENLNITMMDQSGRQRRVPVIWLNQELFAQRKNYWEGLVNENGEEIKRPFIAIGRKGIKQGTAPNKRTIPWMKKFGFTRPRTFDGTLMGYDKYLVRQATWVDCDYEVRLVTSYMVDVNVFYQEILRDGFSDGQGYMIINGHQIRSILGEPSEDNQVSSIDDERVFQITAPLTVHGKLFDPADHEKRTTINKVVVKMCEDGSENSGMERTFGGQSSQKPFRTSCDPVNVFDYNNVLLSSVPSGQAYIVSASTVLNISGTTLATLAPGETYTVPAGEVATVLDSTGGTITTIAGGTSGVIGDATIINSTGGTVGTVTAQGVFLAPNSTVQDYSGGTVASLAPNGIYQVPASTVSWSSGGTAATLGPGQNYPLSSVTVLNFTGGTVFNDAEQGQTRTLAGAVVYDYSGGTLFTLAPSGGYTVPASNVTDYSGGTLTNTLGPGATYQVAAASVSDYSGGTLTNTLGPNGNYQVPASSVEDYSGGTLTSTLGPGATYQVAAASVTDYSGGTLISSLGPGATYVVASGRTTVINSTPTTLFDEVIGPGEAVTYEVQDIVIATNAPAQLFSVPSGSGNFFLPDITWVNSLDVDVENYLPIYYSGQSTIPDITVIDAGTGLSATTPVLTNGIANVNFSGTVTVENSNASFTTGYTSYGTYVLPDINILNSTGETITTYPSVTAYTIADLTFQNSTGGTVGSINGVYPNGGPIIIPEFTIINSDGQSGTTFAYNNEVYTNFSGGSGGITPSGITYQRPAPSPIGTIYYTGDTTWHAANGTYDWASTVNPERLARVDYSSTEADVRGTYYGPAADGSDAIYPTYLEQNNAFGNRYRFTDDAGNPSDSSASSLWAHVDFNNHSYAGATSNYVIDHLTGLGYYTDNITNGTKYNMNTTVAADGHTWEEWLDHIRTGVTVGSYSDFRMPSWEEACSGPMTPYHYQHDWPENILENFRRYMPTSTNSSAGACICLWDSTSSSQFSGYLAKAGSSSFSHRISYIFAIRTHY